MAAVTAGTLRPVSPPAYEVNDRGQAAVAITKGQLLIITAATPGTGYEFVVALATTTTTDPHAIALMDAAAGSLASIGIQGEMDGYTGLTPGAPLWPSATVAGGTDTTAPTGAGSPRIRALTATRIRYSFV